MAEAIAKISKSFIPHCLCVCVCVCVCVYVCVCVWVRLRPCTVKASSVCISWTAIQQITNVVLKAFISYAKSLYHYFRTKHLTPLNRNFIQFTKSWQRKDRSLIFPKKTFYMKLPIFFYPELLKTRQNECWIEQLK